MTRIVGIALLVLISASLLAQKPVATPSVSGSREMSVNFYPNPAGQTINFEFPNAVERGFNLQIFSFVGRKIFTIPVTSNRTSVNLSALFNGIYVFQLRDFSGRILACNKFQVSR